MMVLAAVLIIASSQSPWTIGSRVHSVGSVCARPDTLGAGPAPCGTGGTLRVAGSKGTVVRGPAGSTTKWGVSWFVHYDIPPDGWSTAQYLTLDTLFVPPPPPPPPPSTTGFFVQGFRLDSLMVPIFPGTYTLMFTDSLGARIGRVSCTVVKP